jgi:N-acyl-D-amino-acid deacylase
MLSFMRDHDVPGASLAIARHGRIVYARGFGWADAENRQPVEPDALFRIASVSKPFTAVAILQLVERGKLRLDDHPFRLLDLTPHVEPGKRVDPRIWKITIGDLLHHAGGFDRGASFDPMFRPLEIAAALGTKPPAGTHDVIRYMMGRPLDFDPGTKERYSNFGYCVLGRVIEKVSGQAYGDYVRHEVLRPLGITRMRLAGTRDQARVADEVRYYAHSSQLVTSAFGDGARVPVQYGGWYIEAMDAHGGWIASARELVRFAAAFDDPVHSPVLKPDSIEEMFRRPRVTGFDAAGNPKPLYYACGWEVRPTSGPVAGMSAWHAGLLDGTASLIVRRHDGLAWAVLFNTDRDARGTYLVDVIDPMIHPVADGIKTWPIGREFREIGKN